MRTDWQSSAARGRGTVSALIPADADLALALDFAAPDTCAASWCCLPVRRDPEPRLPTLAQAGAVQEANLPGQPPRQRLVKRKARKAAQRQDDTHAPVRGRCILLYAPGVLRGRSP